MIIIRVYSSKIEDFLYVSNFQFIEDYDGYSIKKVLVNNCTDAFKSCCDKSNFLSLYSYEFIHLINTLKHYSFIDGGYFEVSLVDIITGEIIENFPRIK